MKTMTLAQHYVINCIDGEGFDVDLSKASIRRKVSFFYTTFKEEYGYNIKRYGLKGAIREYLSGLPSCMNIAFNNCDIIKIGEEWLVDMSTEDKIDDFLLAWFNTLAEALVFHLKIHTPA